jgi:hypothetical protein
VCGLVGMIGTLDVTLQSRVFPDLLHACSARGRDSTGAVAVHTDGKATGAKMIGGPDYLLDSRMYKTFVDDPVAMALLGHCRSRTVGSASDPKNAHPFEFSDVIGMHNGTLRDYSDLPGYRKFDVDSEVLYHAINEMGVEEAIPLITGAWALVWYDKKAKTVNFLRNSERELYFLWDEKAETMFWASETWMFGAVERKVKILDKDEKGNYEYPYKLLPENILWSFRLERKEGKTKITSLEQRTIEGKKYQGSVSYQGGWASRKDWCGSTWDFNPKTGLYERKQEKGGEVSDPFPDDPLPFPTKETKNGTAGESKNTIDSSVKFLTTSAKNTGSPSDSNTSTNSQKSTTSQTQGQASKGSPSSLKEKLSEDSSKLKRRPKGFTSLREIRGIWYITNNITSDEWSEREFEDNTGAVCCFCDEPIGGLEEVHRIFDKNRFICTSCVQPVKTVIRVK